MLRQLRAHHIKNRLGLCSGKNNGVNNPQISKFSVLPKYFYYNKGWNSQTKHLLKRFLNKANLNLQFLGPNFPYLTIFDWQFTERLRRKRLRKNIFILTRRIRMGRSRKFIMINCIIKTISIGKIMNNFMKRLLRCSYLPRSPF